MTSYTKQDFCIGEVYEVVVLTGVRQEPRARYAGLVLETGSEYLKLKDPACRYLIAVSYRDIVSARTVRTRGDAAQRQWAERLRQELGFDENWQQAGWTLKWMPKEMAFMLYRDQEVLERALAPFNGIDDEDDGEYVARVCLDGKSLELAPNYVNMTSYADWLDGRENPPVIFTTVSADINVERMLYFCQPEGAALEDSRLRAFESTSFVYGSRLTKRTFDRILASVKKRQPLAPSEK